MKEMMVLEARLNSAENEQIKCESEKNNLERELALLRQSQDQLLNKIKES